MIDDTKVGLHRQYTAHIVKQKRYNFLYLGIQKGYIFQKRNRQNLSDRLLRQKKRPPRMGQPSKLLEYSD